MDPFRDLCFYHINVMRDGLKSNVKLFAGNTSLYSVVKNKEESASYLTNDLDTILNGHITGILHSIQTPKNLRTSFCSLEKT